MAEQIVEYQIGADADALKRAMADAEAAAQKLGKSIGNALAKGGADGTRDLGQSLDRGLDDAGRRSSRTAQAIGTALGRALGVGMVAAAGAAFTKALEQLKDIEDTAKRVGLTVSQLGALRSVGSTEGLSGATVNKDVNDLAQKANEEFRTGEGELSNLLKANNLQITNRYGELKNTNQLLEDAARLVSNANTEFDKIDIARIFGLSQDWVKVLEQGPEALRRALGEAEALGGAFDTELVARAAAFDKAWADGWAAFSLNAKAAIASAAAGLASLVSQAIDLGGRIAAASAATAGAGQAGLDAKAERNRRFNEALRGTRPPEVQAILSGANTAAFRQSEAAFANQFINAPAPPGAGDAAAARKLSPLTGTKIPGKDKGGPGGGKSDEDTALSRLENYTMALQRQGDVLAAEIETFGKSNAERKAAVELAKAKNDLDKLDEETKARVSEQIRAAVAVNEQYRESLDRLKGAQQAASFAAEQFSDALADIIVDGKNAKDVLQGLVKNFARQAINSLFAGSGSFAGVFGQQKGGIFGSLFSGLFGGKFADGGELPRGISLVGERGPELIRNSGNGAARVYPSGQGPSGAVGGSTQFVTIDARGADAGAVSRIENAIRVMDKQFSARVFAVNRQSQVRGIA